MHSIQKKLRQLLLLTLFSLPVFAQQLAYKPGGGVALFSDEDMWKLRLLGYIQSTQTLHTATENDAISNEFFVRRARLDFIFDYKNRYQMFFELDARGSRTEMVLAQFDIKYAGNHTIRVGKFITPFSPENNRSSRSLTTVERYSGLNSVFLLPGLDTQYGVMLFAKSGKWDYYLSATNGNGKASQNVREDNNFKDLQARLVHHLSGKLHVGASANYDDESPQVISLVDHTFTPFNSAAVGGKRLGFLADIEFNNHPLLLRGEVFRYQFDDGLSPTQQIESFLGGYVEGGYFLNGNTTDGLQLIGRVETAQYGNLHESLSGPEKLTSLLLGNNFYKDGIMRLQVNLIYEMADAVTPFSESRFGGKDNAFEILTMLQLKF